MRVSREKLHYQNSITSSNRLTLVCSRNRSVNAVPLIYPAAPATDAIIGSGSVPAGATEFIARGFTVVRDERR